MEERKSVNNGPKKILVVEDEMAILQICQRVLTKEGFEVFSAVNGKTAQEEIARETYDLLMIDIRTPEMNGEELYEWLKGNHPELIWKVL